MMEENSKTTSNKVSDQEKQMMVEKDIQEKESKKIVDRKMDIPEVTMTN